MRERVLKLPICLAAQMSGWDDIAERVKQHFLQVLAGLNSPTRPMGIFLFIGGEAKIRFAYALSHCLYNEPPEHIQMREYADSAALPRLWKYLANVVRTHPHKVLLFEDIDQLTHENLRALSLFFNNANATDIEVQPVDFTGVIWIMTMTSRPIIRWQSVSSGGKRSMIHRIGRFRSISAVRWTSFIYFDAAQSRSGHLSA